MRLNRDAALTWLNGRAAPITVMHNGTPVVLWTPEDGISIEDAIAQFCADHGINMEAEAGD